MAPARQKQTNARPLLPVELLAASQVQRLPQGLHPLSSHSSPVGFTSGVSRREEVPGPASVRVRLGLRLGIVQGD